MKCLVLYNPYSMKGHGLSNAEKIKTIYENADISFEDMTKISDVATFLTSVPKDTRLIFTGGDGTLNIVINKILNSKVTRDIYYFPAGSGNDFVNDIGKEKGKEPFLLNPYMESLPSVSVDGKEPVKFINGVGYGLDGYCCEEADRLRKKSKTRSYTMIAFFGLLHKFKPCGGFITVDGVKKRYEKIWMAPTMLGSYFGGGVYIAPDQKRGNKEHTVTQVSIHDVNRIKTLFLFLDVTKGKGYKYQDAIEYRKGHEVTVEFDSPCALQVDGETYLNVKKYKVSYT